jgi:hypothetical protein
MTIAPEVAAFLACLLLLGAVGGLSSFLIALKFDHYKNNRFVRKLAIELVGGAVAAPPLGYMFKESQYVYILAFLIGTMWAHILQRVRNRVTNLVDAALGEATSGPK